MDAQFLTNSWKHAFGSELPAAFLLREPFSERWLRIHSLPESKRYPESAAEYDEVIARHNSVATHALGESSRCCLFLTQFGENRQWIDEGFASLGGDIPTHVMALDDPDDPLQFFGLQVTWRRNAFDKLICAVADDKTGPVLFANPDARAIYAPYDGGADLFFASAAEAHAARSKFRPWLAAREAGM